MLGEGSPAVTSKKTAKFKLNLEMNITAVVAPNFCSLLTVLTSFAYFQIYADLTVLNPTCLVLRTFMVF